MAKKRILFHANAAYSYVQGSYSGINRVTYEFLEHLAEAKELPYDFMLYTQGLKRRYLDFSHAFQPGVHVFFPNAMPFPRFFLYAPLREFACSYDLFHIPHNFDYCYRPEKAIVTLHDAMIYAYPQEFPGEDLRKKELKSLLTKSAAVLTCSENSKKDILNAVDIPEQKIHVAPWGVNLSYFNSEKLSDDNVIAVKKLIGGNSFFLSVSCDTGRKNTIAIINAYKKLAINSLSYKLVLIWNNMPEYLKKECDECSGIVVLSEVDDAMLSMLYKSAAALFFVSKYEGFGLPILEAMSCGTPVVTCSNSALVEVGGDAAIYVDPDDISGIALIMERIENNDFDLLLYSKKSIERASCFSWDLCLNKTLACYEYALQ